MVDMIIRDAHRNTRDSLKTREVLWRWIQHADDGYNMPRLVWRNDAWDDLFPMSPNEILAKKKLYG